MFRLLARFFDWLDTFDDDLSYPQLVLGALSGIAVGYFLVTAVEQTAILHDLSILAHEQRRMTLAAAARALHTQQASSHDKEGFDDGPITA